MALERARRIGIRRGGAAGVAGALAMALVMMALTASAGGSFWTPLRYLGATVFGTGYDTALSGVLGLVIHCIVGAALGAVFFAPTGRVRSAATEAILGIVFGAVAFAPMTYLVLPIANPVMFQRMHLGVLFVAHLVYGLVTGIAIGSPERAGEPRRVGPSVERRATA